MVNLISRSFIMLPGIGPIKEIALWKDGVMDLETFIIRPKVPGVSKGRKAELDKLAASLASHLRRRDVRFLARHLPRREHWRLYGLARPHAAFIDIETDGLAANSRITVIGIMIGRRFTTLVRERNMTRRALTVALRGATMLITFNGASFDLPFIERDFPGILPTTVPRLDLRHATRRIGLSGGLKRIEQKLGVRRKAEVQMIAGNDAVRLWRIWERKRCKRALEVLVDYNREDVRNMRPVADMVFDGLSTMTSP